MDKDLKIGILIRNLRKSKGLSQFQLGKLLGISDRAISKWENGLSKPSINLLSKISEIFCLSTDNLLCANIASDDIIRLEIIKKNNDIWGKIDKSLLDRYGPFPPIEVISRVEKERFALKDSSVLQMMFFVSILKAKAAKEGSKINVMGGVGGSFIAFMLGITDINPLPPHYYCSKCKSTLFISEITDGWDLPQKKCACCNNWLEGDGHNIPFEVYRHTICSNASFDIMIKGKFFNSAEHFIESKLNNFSITIVKNPLELYHKKNTTDATTYVIHPIEKKRFVNRIDAFPTTNQYISYLSNRPYINIIINDSFEKETELENLVNYPCERIQYNKRFLDFIIEKRMIPEKPSFAKLLDKYKINSFNELIHLFGIAMLSDIYPNIVDLSHLNTLPLDKTIVYRDDLFDLICTKLRSYGCYESEIACKIMNNARKGKYYLNDLDDKTKTTLMTIGFSNNFFSFLTSIKYMFSKAAGILYMKQELILLWYKYRFPNEYSACFKN